MLSPFILAHVMTPKFISELTRAIHNATPTPSRAIFFIVNNNLEILIHIHNPREKKKAVRCTALIEGNIRYQL